MGLDAGRALLHHVLGGEGADFVAVAELDLQRRVVDLEMVLEFMGDLGQRLVARVAV